MTRRHTRLSRFESRGVPRPTPSVEGCVRTWAVPSACGAGVGDARRFADEPDINLVLSDLSDEVLERTVARLGDTAVALGRC
jgi:hypothetical protein